MSIVSGLAETSVLPITDVLAWIVIGTFLVGVLADWRGRDDLAPRITGVAWWLFGVFWFLLIQHFAFVMRSIVETFLIIVAVPACVYVGYWVFKGRGELLTLSRAVALMGLIYLPFTTSAAAQGFLIETVAHQTAVGIQWIGYAEGVQLIQDPTGKTSLANTFWFPESNRASRIVFACTGIGAMSVFGGLVAAVRAPLRRKLAALGIAIGIIWVLNIARNVFIAVANGYQWFDYAALEGPVMFAFGLTDPSRVSFFVADRIIAQGLAVFVLIGIGLLIARWLPELYEIIEELYALVTGQEVSFRDGGSGGSGGAPIADGGSSDALGATGASNESQGTGDNGGE